MSKEEVPLHYVSTREKASELAITFDRFWVSNCGCREERGKCETSRMDLCLMFTDEFPSTGSGKKEITIEEVKKIFEEAERKHLITRPWRDETRTLTEGICFCCPDCCGYFLSPNEFACDKGEYIEMTDFDECTDCAICVDVCYFKARKMDNEKLVVKRENCFGCGLCSDICPEDCIKTVPRRLSSQ